MAEEMVFSQGLWGGAGCSWWVPESGEKLHHSSHRSLCQFQAQLRLHILSAVEVISLQMTAPQPQVTASLFPTLLPLAAT